MARPIRRDVAAATRDSGTGEARRRPLEVLRTRELTPARLRRIREMLTEAFEGEFSDDDWAHSVGGHHVIVGFADVHAAVVERRIEVGARTVRAGYVEAVATAPVLQGRGLGSMVMARVGDLLRAEFDLGVLSTAAHRFYRRFGWERWQGPS